ncbi:universal stress protein [Actinomycetospora endophytica]|uniref:Universal stress protein n=1 Tax=Actinomycetospora endophytica TaxID=2291215 RepID=A0ABS8PCY4_9PSEU|nr:universal stress protein [Actinomycetospora endophytica]MCD2194859.1 universal stress protein [Actinomycetospora endophytica]
MTLLVGLSPDARDDAGGAVGLAARLAVAWKEDVTVAVVLTPGSRVSPEAGETGIDVDAPAVVSVDADPAADAARAAVEGILDESGLTARWVTVRGRSVADALLEAAATPGVTAVVLGTDPDRSGRIAVRVARDSPVPVVLARGHGAFPNEPISRVTCAFDGTDASPGVLATAAELADRSSATLRVASFAVRRPTTPPEVGLNPGAPVLAGWSEQIAAAQADALTDLGRSAETGVHAGATWDEAVHATDWEPGDLLVVGGSPGAATRFFLGDRLGAILQAAPVPAVIVRSG